MKINNKNIIKFLFVIHITLLVATICLLVLPDLFFPALFSKIQFIGYTLMIYSSIKIYGLKYIEYENSGEVLSIKSHSVFNKDIQKKQMELPLDKIHQLSLQKSFFHNYLIIERERDDESLIKILPSESKMSSE